MFSRELLAAYGIFLIGPFFGYLIGGPLGMAIVAMLGVACLVAAFRRKDEIKGEGESLFNTTIPWAELNHPKPSWEAKHERTEAGVALFAFVKNLQSGSHELLCHLVTPDGKIRRGRTVWGEGVTGLGVSADFPRGFGLWRPRRGKYRVLWISAKFGGSVAEDEFIW